MSWVLEVVHHLVGEGVKHVNEQKRREAAARAEAEREAIENEKRSVINTIEGFIKNDIPIPQQFKLTCPDLVVETALRLGRRDLVSEMLFVFEQRRQARIDARLAAEKARRKDKWVMRLIKFCVLLFVGLIVYLVARRL